MKHRIYLLFVGFKNYTCNKRTPRVIFEQTESVAKTVCRGVRHGLLTGIKTRQGRKEVRVRSSSQRNEIYIIFITYVLELY